MSKRHRAIIGIIAAISSLVIAACVTFIAIQHNHIHDLSDQVTVLQAQIKATQSTPSYGTSQQTKSSANNGQHRSAKNVIVFLYTPALNSKLTNPVTIIGEVPGNWSFEASFPIKLMDSQGAVIAQTTAHVLGDWMTAQLVPFSASLTFTGTPSGSGVLILEKDNPSGQAQNDDSVSIPVTF